MGLRRHEACRCWRCRRESLLQYVLTPLPWSHFTPNAAATLCVETQTQTQNISSSRGELVSSVTLAPRVEFRRRKGEKALPLVVARETQEEKLSNTMYAFVFVVGVGLSLAPRAAAILKYKLAARSCARPAPCCSCNVFQLRLIDCTLRPSGSLACYPTRCDHSLTTHQPKWKAPRMTRPRGQREEENAKVQKGLSERRKEEGQKCGAILLALRGSLRSEGAARVEGLPALHVHQTPTMSMLRKVALSGAGALGAASVGAAYV